MSIDKSQVAQRFEKAAQSYTQHAVVQKKICQNLTRLMQEYLSKKSLDGVFEIGCGSGNLTHLLLQYFVIKQLFLNDLYPQVQQHFQVKENLQWRIGDIEQLDFPHALGLIASSSALQWICDLDAIFKKCSDALTDKGYLCFSTFGQQNLKEIKALTGQGLNYLSLEEIQEKLLLKNFEILHLSENIETLTFHHPKEVLQHLKATGVTATASQHRWSKQSLQQFYQDYLKFSELEQNGQRHYQLSYHPIYCIARSKS
ncbi:malonyl-[acyl-carrier protein] O-methyltransferase BioC [Acinetobacter sp. ANC 4779]|uniref:malonyl-ACP O-methyltransferase BioC n=1 Tax=Acinetobacter sp. ANC 4779 TaxID=2529848 RepID=UPI00103A996C|nr:malonyl-ACP O-methyltransferase BioC [Acinetobacter sp. ANC 4779]TCB49604.1 malonyl-[acyl-carrier protein] O-methyltransferase BioC [Acinetobacter sp. ANC 4779]